MVAERVTRARVVEYRISYIQRRREIYVYIGSTWVGRIIKVVDDPLHKATHFGCFLQVPGCWGPVAREPTVHEAKIALTIAIRGWLETFSGIPVDVEERPEREVVAAGRVTRTRSPAPVVTEPTRIRRTR